MIDLEQLQVLAQLIDNMEVLNKKLEKAYNKNDAEEFNNRKKEIIEVKEKISKLII